MIIFYVLGSHCRSSSSNSSSSSSGKLFELFVGALPGAQKEPVNFADALESESSCLSLKAQRELALGALSFLRGYMSGEKNSFLKDSYTATIGGRPILPLFTRGSVYFGTLIACDQVYFGAHMSLGPGALFSGAP